MNVVERTKRRSIFTGRHFCVVVAIASGVALAALDMPLVHGANLSETAGIDSFSSDYQNPTLFSLEVGSNLLTGEVGAAGSGTLLADGSDGGTDGDYFTVVVPEGLLVEQIFVNRYNQLQRGFAIYAPGESFGAPIAQGPNVFYPFADGALFAGSGDIVPLPPQPLFIGSGAPFDPSDGGFNVDSLSAGTYAFLIQENQVGASEYVWEFSVVPIPEPSTWALVLLGWIGGLSWSRRKTCRNILVTDNQEAELVNTGTKAINWRLTRRVGCLWALVLTCCWGSSTSAQTLVDNLGGALSDGGSISVSGQVTQIAFHPGDDTHAYVTTFGSGILRYDYDPTVTNFLSNPMAVVPTSISSQGGVNGSLGIAFHEDASLGTVMYIAPAVPFTGGGGLNNLHNQSIVRLTDTNGDGIFGNHASDLNHNIVNNVNVSQVHQINQLQIRGDTLYAAIGIRTQNGGQTAAENIAIGGSGVNQSNPGETEYTGTVSFIENLNNVGPGTNSAGFSIPNNQTAIKSDTQAFTSTADNKLRVYATGFRNNYGIGIDDSDEMWVSYNQNENPNAEDELHRNVTFQSDHQFFKGNDVVGNWKDPANSHASAQAAQNAGFFDSNNSVAPFELVGFNTAAGGLDFFSQDTTDVLLRGDVLLSRNSGSGSDVLYVDQQTGNSFVVLEGLGGALEVQRDPFGNFLAGGTGKISLIDVVTTDEPSSVLGDFNNDSLLTVVDWNLFKPLFGTDTSGLDAATARAAGDLDVSGLVDLVDANIFAEIYDAANGVGSFAKLGFTVPEPKSCFLMMSVVLCLVLHVRRGRLAAYV